MPLAIIFDAFGQHFYADGPPILLLFHCRKTPFLEEAISEYRYPGLLLGWRPRLREFSSLSIRSQAGHSRWYRSGPIPSRFRGNGHRGRETPRQFGNPPGAALQK